MRVLVLGGTGAMAARVTTACLAAGDDVMVVSRGHRAAPPRTLDPAGTDAAAPAVSPEAATVQPGSLIWLRSDRADLAQHEGEIEAFGPHAVVDAICFDASDAAQLATLADLGPGARRVVMISTVDVYGEDVGAAPVTEDHEPAPVTPYARGKRAAELLLLEELGPRVTIVRPSHMLGRGFRTAGLWGRTEHVVARLRAGLPVAVLDGGRGVITPVWAGDVAAWVRASLTSSRAAGEVINAVGGEITTMAHYVEAIAAHLGVAPPRLVPVPSPVVREALGTATQFAFHRPYSCEKAVRLLGRRPAGTLASMIAETVAAMPERHLDDPDLPPELLAASAAEDAIVALVDRHAAELATVLRANDPRVTA